MALLFALLWMLAAAGASGGGGGRQAVADSGSMAGLAEVMHLFRIDQALEAIEPADQRVAMAKCILKARSGTAHIVLAEQEASHAAVQCLARLCEVNVTTTSHFANSSIAYALHAVHSTPAAAAAAASSFTDVCTRVAELLLEDVIAAAASSSSSSPSSLGPANAPPPDDRSLVLSEFKRGGAGQPLTTRAHRLWQLYSSKFRALRDVKVRLYDASRAPALLVSQHCLPVLACGGQLRDQLGGALCAEVFRKEAGAGLVALDLAGSGANKTMLELGLFPSCNLYVR